MTVPTLDTHRLHMVAMTEGDRLRSRFTLPCEVRRSRNHITDCTQAAHRGQHKHDAGPCPGIRTRWKELRHRSPLPSVDPVRPESLPGSRARPCCNSSEKYSVADASALPPKDDGLGLTELLWSAKTLRKLPRPWISDRHSSSLDKKTYKGAVS